MKKGIFALLFTVAFAAYAQADEQVETETPTGWINLFYAQSSVSCRIAPKTGEVQFWQRRTGKWSSEANQIESVMAQAERSQDPIYEMYFPDGRDNALVLSVPGRSFEIPFPDHQRAVDFVSGFNRYSSYERNHGDLLLAYFSNCKASFIYSVRNGILQRAQDFFRAPRLPEGSSSQRSEREPLPISEEITGYDSLPFEE